MTHREVTEVCEAVYRVLFSFGGFPQAWTKHASAWVRDEIGGKIPLYGNVSGLIEQHVLVELQK